MHKKTSKPKLVTGCSDATGYALALLLTQGQPLKISIPIIRIGGPESVCDERNKRPRRQLSLLELELAYLI